MNRYYETMMALAASFMRVVARSLDQDETYFASLAKDPISFVALNHFVIGLSRRAVLSVYCTTHLRKSHQKMLYRSEQAL